MKRMLGVLLAILLLVGCVPVTAPAPASDPTPNQGQAVPEDPKYGVLRLEVPVDDVPEGYWGVSVRIDDVDPTYDISEGGRVTVVLPVGIHKISGTKSAWLPGRVMGPFPISDYVTLVEAGTTWTAWW